jgi:hypothetical protein
MMGELSTVFGGNSMRAFGHRWKSKRYVVVTIYFICCAYLIGLSVDLRSLEYVLSIFLIMGLVLLLMGWLAGRPRLRSDSGDGDRIRDLSMLAAGAGGILVNALLQGMTVLYEHVAIPKGAFISVYCALLLLGSPMPLLPGDTLFYKASRRAHSILFLAVVVSSFWRIGMLIPALFIYFDKDCSSAERISSKAFGMTMVGLSLIAAIGVVLASR